MKIVVLGASGLIGAKTADILVRQGHEVARASRKTGVDSVSGDGLDDALSSADVVLDLTNSPSFEEQAVMHFFKNSTTNLLSAATKAGVKQIVALSVVGTQGLQSSPYFRAKKVQEDLIADGKVPFTIVQATQFFEFLGGIADAATVDGTAFLSTGLIQPISADDVAQIMAEIALEKPVNATIEIAGPECLPLAEMVQKYLRANHDERKIIADKDASYFGMVLTEKSLIPAGKARMSKTSLENWMGQTAGARA